MPHVPVTAQAVRLLANDSLKGTGWTIVCADAAVGLSSEMPPIGFTAYTR